MYEEFNEDAVEPQEPIEQIVDDALPDDQPEGEIEQTHTPKMVPLTALQKLREKKRELELELQWERQKNAPRQEKPVEEDDSQYESATKQDLRNSQDEALRLLEEKLWIKQNPEKYELVNESLAKFLKQRPNLAVAITQASNRYEEAYTLMEALSPRQKQQLKTATIPKKDSPNSPGGVPKAASLNETVDVMNMSDSEYQAWRKSKRRR